MKMFKKNDGFTLVELIVVIAILAILAGVGVAGYSGYIAKAQTAADTTSLSAIKTACMASQATKGEVTEITVTAAVPANGTNGTISKVEVKVKSGETTSPVTLYDSSVTPIWPNDDFKTYMNSAMPELKYYTTGAVWTSTSGKWEAKSGS